MLLFMLATDTVTTPTLRRRFNDYYNLVTEPIFNPIFKPDFLQPKEARLVFVYAPLNFMC